MLNPGICNRIMKSNLPEDDKIDLIKIIGLFESKDDASVESDKYYSKEDEKIDQHEMNKNIVDNFVDNNIESLDNVLNSLKEQKPKSSLLKGDDDDDRRINIMEEVRALLIRALDRRIDNPNLNRITERGDDLVVKVFDIQEDTFKLLIGINGTKGISKGKCKGDSKN